MKKQKPMETVRDKERLQLMNGGKRLIIGNRGHDGVTGRRQWVGRRNEPRGRKGDERGTARVDRIKTSRGATKDCRREG